MRQIDVEDLSDLALGATLLGSGGGGSPDYDLLMAENHVKKYGNALLVDVNELKKDDLVVPIAFGGAPLVSSELLPSGRECDELLELIQAYYGRPPSYLMPAEIGGANALAPFLYASRLGIPVLDADTIGRAFPELHMSSCNVHGISPCPAFVIDALGNSVIIKAQNAKTLEFIARKNIVAMGSSALVGIYLMDGLAAKECVVKGSISTAISLGKSMRHSKERGENPMETLIRDHGAQHLGMGIIDAIDQTIDEGFLNGSVTILNGECVYNIAYQNEYLKVESDGKIIAVTPEIITLIESESFVPITSEKLLYGMRVSIVSLPSPPLWMTESAHKMVGPVYFGYKTKEIL